MPYLQRGIDQFQDLDGSRKNVMHVYCYLVSRLTNGMCRYPQLVGVRICLGFAEAGLFPGVVY